MIVELYAALDAALRDWADKAAAQYKPSADPFSFDADPRADLTSYHVDPPTSRQVSGYLGGGGLDVTVITVWASLEARDDPAAAGLALANDLAALRDAIRDADLGDVNLRPTVETSIAARADDGVTVTGRLRFEFEIEV